MPERTGFREIYEDHAPAVFRCLLSWSRNQALSEDLLAETFVHAIAAEQPIRLATARGYLVTIARNLWRMHVRQSLRRQESTGGDVAGAAPSAPRTDPVESIALERILAAMAALPETLREPIVLYAQGGLSYEEIAASLGVSVAVVKVRIFRARQKLEPYR